MDDQYVRRTESSQARNDSGSLTPDSTGSVTGVSDWGRPILKGVLGEVAGDEVVVLGLQRAFMVADANTVIASLWAVERRPDC